MSTKIVTFFRLSIVFGLLSLSTAFSGIGAFAGQDSSCLNCHAEFKKQSKDSHSSLTIGCNACHVIVQDKKHPHQKDSVKLVRDVPDLCFGCHKKSNFQNTDTHPPVAEGKCTSCHNPHGSIFGKLLICDPPELCYGCHNKADYTKKYVHPVIIGRRCDCHNPHASNYPYLLSTTINEGCIGCHKAKGSGNHVVSLPKGKTHPIEGTGPGNRNTQKKISCATCHNPHSSDYRKLFPKTSMCRICHKYY